MTARRRITTKRAASPIGFPIGCGVDVVELPRFTRAIRRGDRAFVRRIFTASEQAYARKLPRTMLLHLAGRFAAKEAVIKAISQVEPSRMLAMNEIEIRNDHLGRPSIQLHDGPNHSLVVHVSLSHVNSVAVASAIVMKRAALEQLTP